MDYIDTKNQMRYKPVVGWTASRHRSCLFEICTMSNDSNQDCTPDFRDLDAFFNLRTVEAHAPHIIPYIKSDSRIIDVGCGIGSITLDLARRAPQGYVLGVDYSASSSLHRRWSQQFILHRLAYRFRCGRESSSRGCWTDQCGLHAS